MCFFDYLRKIDTDIRKKELQLYRTKNEYYIHPQEDGKIFKNFPSSKLYVHTK